MNAVKPSSPASLSLGNDKDLKDRAKQVAKLLVLTVESIDHKGYKGWTFSNSIRIRGSSQSHAGVLELHVFRLKVHRQLTKRVPDCDVYIEPTKWPDVFSIWAAMPFPSPK
jgi:hypothetical protein